MNLFHDQDREALIGRIQKLGPDSPRLWGTMTLPAALAHMNRQIALALGEIESQTRRSPLGYFPFNYLVIHVLPWPKSAKTAPILLDMDADDVEAERQGLLTTIRKAADRGIDGEWTPHPLFGKLSGRSWGAVMGKHLDHHLRQFSA